MSDFQSGLPADQAHARLRESLQTLQQAEKNAVLWFDEIRRRRLYRALGYSSIHAYAVTANWRPRSRPAASARSRKGGGIRRRPADLPAGKLPSGREELLLAGLSSLLDSISMRQEDVGHAPSQECVGRAQDPVRENSRAGSTIEMCTRVNPGTHERVSRGRNSDAVSGPAFQIIVHKCEDCGRASVVSGRGDLALSTATLARVECDSRVLRPGKRNKASIPPGLRKRVMARDGHRCRAPGCSSTRFLEVHHLRPRAEGGGNEPENLVTLCASCHQLLHEMSATCSSRIDGLSLLG